MPSSLNLPPAGRSAVTVTGDLEVSETSEAVTLTWSYVLRFCEFVEPTRMLPSLSVSLLIETSAAPAVGEGFSVGACLACAFAAAAPSDE